MEEEIRDINSRLIDTIVEVSAEATEEVAARGQNGIVLSCCYKGNASSPSLYFLQAKEYSMVKTLADSQITLVDVISVLVIFTFIYLCWFLISTDFAPAHIWLTLCVVSMPLSCDFLTQCTEKSE